jgi:hypothetical protein
MNTMQRIGWGILKLIAVRSDPMQHKYHQSHGPLRWTTFLIFSLAALAVYADFNGTDNFSSGSGQWDVVSNAGITGLTVTNGRYEYTDADTGAGTANSAWRRWNVNHGSYTNDWAVQVDVHLVAFPGLTSHQYINLNMVVQDGANSNNAYCQSINRDARPMLDFESGTRASGITTEVANPTTNAALRISFDSAAKTLTAWYDTDGAANGYTWIPMETVSIANGTNGWGMASNSQFNVLLVGGSGGVNNGQTGLNFSVTSGQAYYDNFLATSGPNPTNSFVVVSTNWGMCLGAAFDGTNYLVGIQQSITAASNSVSPIMAQLISQAGTTVGPLISVGRTGGAPLVAFDGAHYLMVWTDDARGSTNNDNFSVYGQIVHPSGALVGSAFLISEVPPGPIDERPYGLSFDGNNYLVAYGIGTNIHSGPVNQLAARFVSPAAVVGSEITLATATNAICWNAGGGGACNGTNYLVTWMQHNGGNSNDVYGVLVSKTGIPSAPFRINQNTSPSHNPMSVASDGSNFFVVWPYDTGSGSENPPLWELHGRLVTAAGGFGSTEFTVAGVTNAPCFPFLVFDGANYFVSWTDQSNTNDWNITGQFVTQTGALLGSARNLVTSPGNQALSPVVYGNGKDLVLWNDGFTTNNVSFSTAIRGLFLPVTATITVNSSTNVGGSVTGSGTFVVGSTNWITATASNGWAFAGWSDGVTNNPRSIVVVSNMTFTANFSQQKVTITVQTSPSGRSFTVDGTTYASAQTFSWVSGANHSIATSSPQSGGPGIQYVWSTWSDSGALSHTVAPTVGTTYTGNFTTQYNLTMSMGTGGNNVSPASGWQNSGAVVPISATAASGYSFGSWTGSGSGSYSGSSNATSVTMNGPITETAKFATGIGAALDATNLMWSTGGNANWAVQTATTHDGVAALQSGAIGAGQQTWFQTTTNGPGSLMFWWKVSSAPANYLQFYINTQLVSQISGNVDWNQVVTFIGTSNQVTLKWVYTNTTGAASGSNAGWVDQVTWMPSLYATNAPQIFYQDPGNLIASWVLNSTGGVETVRLLGLTPGWSIKAAGDIDGDGVSDLIFQGGGLVAVWFMNADGSVRSGKGLGATGVWDVRACGDFFGTGRAQLFFQNGSTVAYWQMDTNGTFQSAGTYPNLGSWQLRGVGRVASANQGEAFFLNAGTMAIWFRDGSTSNIVGVLARPNPALPVSATNPLYNVGAWQLSGVVDIDGDGTSDLLWQSPDGWTGGWFMQTNGTARDARGWWNTAPWKLKAAGR